MSISKSTRTVTVTHNQLQEMIRAQRTARDFLIDNNQDTKAMAMSFTSFSTGILGLVFRAHPATSVAAGIVSVLTAGGATTRQTVIDNVKNGYIDLLETANTFNNVGAVKVNMTLTCDVVNLKDKVEFIGKVKVNYYENKYGHRLMR